MDGVRKPIPKPVKQIKQPKPLQRKKPMKAYAVDKNGFAIFSQGKPLKAKKPINKRGKVYNHWVAFKIQWLHDNPPDYKGEYKCGICKRVVHKLEVTLDHKIPRSRAPELRFDPDNIQPAHYECNSLKGSRIQLVDGTFKTLPKYL